MNIPSDEELAEIVVMSNAIEKVFEGPGHPLFDDHFMAACAVRDAGKLLTPKQIHKLLMRRQLPDAGEYRRVGVEIVYAAAAAKPMPRATVVPRLMVALNTLVNDAVKVCTEAASDPMTCAVTARILHAHGLCIHPFRDGNGRTFRLWWNQLRQHFGLNWEPILLDGQRTYFKSIEDYEDLVFKPRYPNVY